jgi:hypothetical protein
VTKKRFFKRRRKLIRRRQQEAEASELQPHHVGGQAADEPLRAGVNAIKLFDFKNKKPGNTY